MNPGAALFTAIVAHASKFNLHPDEVYEDYLDHPRSYRLRWAYAGWLEELRSKKN